jgi:hypothetical protein
MGFYPSDSHAQNMGRHLPVAVDASGILDKPPVQGYAILVSDECEGTI